jgi:hypothetical protein
LNTSDPRSAFRVVWSVLIIANTVVFWACPPLGLLIFAGMAACGLFRIGRKVTQYSADQARRAEVAWMGDPYNQQFMRGNGDNGGLSIAEQNYYRKRANEMGR